MMMMIITTTIQSPNSISDHNAMGFLVTEEALWDVIWRHHPTVAGKS